MPELTRSQLPTARAAVAVVPSANPLGFDLRSAKKIQMDFRLAGAKELKSICPYCAVGCGLIAYTKQDANGTTQLLQIEGDPDSPVNEGRLCPKGATAMQLATSARRVEKPLYRAPGATAWEEKSWDFMLDKLAPTKGPGAGGGAKIIHADPRFTRTSALADIYVRMRVGTDVAYFGGLINYVLQNNLFHDEYVRNYTNASFIVKKEFSFNDGLFSGYNKDTRSYDVSSWAYETTTPPAQTGGQVEGPQTTTSGFAKRDMTLQDPQSVFQLLKKHYCRYTPELVESITGIPT